MNLPILKAIEIKKTYPGKPPVEALKGVSIEVNEGNVVALLGPNGAGKTTFVKIITGLLLPDGGDALVRGYSVTKQRHRALSQLVTVLEGDRNLRFRLTGLENAEFFVALSGRKFDKKRCMELADRFGLADAMNRQVRTYSKGMKQKLSVLIAFLTDTPLILLDEPTLGLDVEASNELIEVIKEGADAGHAILITTHEMHIAQKVSTHVAIIKEGKLVTYQRTEQLLELFRYREFLIKVRPNDIELEFPMLRKVESNDNFATFVLDTAEPSDVYQVIDMLRSKNAEILEIVRRQPDLEEVYLRIVKGGGVSNA
ncbi:MAG: hypothetical protein DRQ10_00970 [Candidatus Hydrothermota bacterium]|nr:MAG: hypothetical protein DRQ10_00970 [Candidatus Hydrothermae bacterium]